jgi:hypothetical protein
MSSSDFGRIHDENSYMVESPKVRGSQAMHKLRTHAEQSHLCIHATAQGYPSIGDVQTTVPVPKEKWFEYAGERSGRFQVKQRVILERLCPLVRVTRIAAAPSAQHLGLKGIHAEVAMQPLDITGPMDCLPCQ